MFDEPLPPPASAGGSSAPRRHAASAARHPSGPPSGGPRAREDCRGRPTPAVARPPQPPSALRCGRRLRRFSASCPRDASAPRKPHALDDVGVRFGGSEHHRIGVSSLTCRRPRSSERGKRQTRLASANRAPKPGRGFGQAPGPGSDGNGKRATAAVMRYGCRRGKSSEGVNRVAGNDSTDLCPLPLGADGTGPGSQATRRTPGRLRGAINPRPLERSKPSWW
jgi:hypothetical protein